MNELKNYSNALEETIKDANLHRIGTDLSELVLDRLLDDGLVKDIPIVGTIFSAGKAIVGIKDRLFLKKVIYFISELSEISQSKRKEMIERINTSGDYKLKVGEKLLFIIERCEDHEKAAIIAKMFAAFIKEQITYEEFLRAASIIDRVMQNDLLWVLENANDLYLWEELRDLAHSGIFYVDISNQRDSDLKLPDGYELRAHLTEIGEKMLSILKASN